MMRSISIQLSASGFSKIAHVDWFIQQRRVEARKCSQLGVYDNMGCVAYGGITGSAATDQRRLMPEWPEQEA